MYKKITRAVLEVRELSLEVQCNKCGRSLKLREDGQPGSDEEQEFHDFLVSGGYASRFPEDLTTIKWVMCADCLKVLVESFSVPPDILSYRNQEPSIKAADTNTGLPVEILSGMVYPRGQVPEEPEMWPYEVVAEVDAVEWPPLGVFRHYKGGLYTTVGSCLRADTKEPLVLYRELYGESRLWVRPLSEWFENVSGPDEKKTRFTEVSLESESP